MRVSDIPSEMMSNIRARFESTPEIMTLRTHQQYAQRRGNYGEALAMAQKIDGLFVIVLDQYMRKTEAEIKSLDTRTSSIPQKDKDEMIENLVVLFMVCDIIDTAVLNMNDVLHRSNPDIDISTFSDLGQVAQMARDKLRFLQESSDYMKDLVWADKCDNMYDMCLSKARSIIRKRKESPEWGKNLQTIING